MLINVWVCLKGEQPASSAHPLKHSMVFDKCLCMLVKKVGERFVLQYYEICQQMVLEKSVSVLCFNIMRFVSKWYCEKIGERFVWVYRNGDDIVCVCFKGEQPASSAHPLKHTMNVDKCLGMSQRGTAGEQRAPFGTFDGF